MKIEIVSSIFLDHNAMRLDINYKKKTVRNNHMEIKQHISKKNRSLKKSKGKLKNF